jgi:predicted HTH domain antitoxin
MTEPAIEIKFTLRINDIPEAHRVEAERKAQEAFVMALLRQGDISAGRAAELLGIDRWQLDDLMSAHGISPFDETMTREELEREVTETARLLQAQPRDRRL